jgi:hypothetical protein
LGNVLRELSLGRITKSSSEEIRQAEGRKRRGLARAIATAGDLDPELTEKTIKRIRSRVWTDRRKPHSGCIAPDYLGRLSQPRKTKLGWPKGILRKPKAVMGGTADRLVLPLRKAERKAVQYN